MPGTIRLAVSPIVSGSEFGLVDRDRRSERTICGEPAVGESKVFVEAPAVTPIAMMLTGMVRTRAMLCVVISDGNIDRSIRSRVPD